MLPSSCSTSTSPIPAGMPKIVAQVVGLHHLLNSSTDAALGICVGAPVPFAGPVGGPCPGGDLRRPYDCWSPPCFSVLPSEASPRAALSHPPVAAPDESVYTPEKGPRGGVHRCLPTARGASPLLRLRCLLRCFRRLPPHQSYLCPTQPERLQVHQVHQQLPLGVHLDLLLNARSCRV
jgi:hypothetical protein